MILYLIRTGDAVITCSRSARLKRKKVLDLKVGAGARRSATETNGSVAFTCLFGVPEGPKLQPYERANKSVQVKIPMALQCSAFVFLFVFFFF